MEFTEMKKCLFGGYKKVDVVRYISELNEEHSLELGSKSEELSELKATTEARLNELTNKNKENKHTIEELKSNINLLQQQLDKYQTDYSALQSKYTTMDNETSELRRKSEIISTAIINAEKCAGQLIDDANSNANDIMHRAEKKVEAETLKLGKAKDYVKFAREEMLEVFHKIDEALKTSENSLETKKDSINTVTNDIDSAEKFGIIPKGPWGKRA